MISTLNFDPIAHESLDNSLPSFQFFNYDEAERQFSELLTLKDLDDQIKLQPKLIRVLEVAITIAIQDAYAQNSQSSELASRFLQRVLYRLNRLNLFWYDDLQNYENERSLYLQSLRDRLESHWQAWEVNQLGTEETKRLDAESAKQGLIERADRDLNPLVSESKRYLREDLTLSGYRLLLAIASVDGLVEASRLSRILGGASNEIQATLFRVLLEEYGNGRLARKHSTFFAQMMSELHLNIQTEAYLDLVPWQVLASINHNFLLTERKRYFLRYNGGLTYFEIEGPLIYTDYLIAAERLGLSDAAMGYWKLHIREDERHGQWMLTDVALPLVDMYPDNAWELVLGYDQEKFIGDRAAGAIMNLLQEFNSKSNTLIL